MSSHNIHSLTIDWSRLIAQYMACTAGAGVLMLMVIQSGAIKSRLSRFWLTMRGLPH